MALTLSDVGLMTSHLIIATNTAVVKNPTTSSNNAIRSYILCRFYYFFNLKGTALKLAYLSLAKREVRFTEA